MSDALDSLSPGNFPGPVLALVGPLVMLSTILIPSATVDRAGSRFAKGIAHAALATFVMAGVIALMAVMGLKPQGSHEGLNAYLLIDPLSMTMLVLVSFLTAVITRYSLNYLGGDPRQGRFFKALSVTAGSVMMLIISGNLLVFTLAWISTSMSLHQLLTFYPDRPGAILAARKKFVISRLGDACMIAVLVLTWKQFGTWNFHELFSKVEALRAGEVAGSAIGWTSMLLVTGALLKSAQFPFHSWLPDTMETPTPVSALMHAGIINAGGFLIVRLSPLVASSPAALNTLALIGAITALLASVVMLTQTSVKRSLAYSTIAQMGFMMLQCGLGAFALAILHIVAHSLYKAYAFLSSGSIVQLSKSAWVPSGRPAAHPVILAGTLMTAIGMTWGVGWLFGIHMTGGAEVLLLGSVFTMGVAYLLWNLWSSSHRSGLIARGLMMTALATASYFALHAAAEHLLASCLPHYAPERAPWEYCVMALIGLLFFAILVIQTYLPIWSMTRLGRVLYVHASHGFYLGILAHRIVSVLMPTPIK
jgi:NAD(P)H-quinone oxidoreductase subunit 5